MITVTTPSGTVSQVAGGLSQSLITKEKERQEKERKAKREADAKARVRHVNVLYSSIDADIQAANANATHASGSAGAQAGAARNVSTTGGTAASARTANASAPSNVPIPSHSQPPTAPSGPSTPSAAQFLATTSNQGKNGTAGGQVLEFNHAISFVNKIKNRFNSDPETYKQFLEILQTYQRDTRDIAEVSCPKDQT